MNAEFIVATALALIALLFATCLIRKQYHKITQLLEVIGKQEKLINYLQNEIDDTKSLLRKNKVFMSAQSNFDFENLQNGGEKYVLCIMDNIINDLANNLAKTMKFQLMNEVLENLHTHRINNVTMLRVIIPTIRADYDGIEVIAINNLGESFSLTDNNPLKHILEEQKAAALKIQLDCIDKNYAKELLKQFEEVEA